jgi:hypothetical protein
VRPSRDSGNACLSRANAGGKQAQHARRNHRRTGEGGNPHAELTGEGLEDLLVRAVPPSDQHFADPLAPARGFGQSRPELELVDDAGREQDFADAFAHALLLTPA